ncbi:MAG: UDP-3-O-acyl-N-acetylglucosamine deacetylase [Pseudomonadota bacterium]
MRRTLKSSAEFSGVGLHGGQPVAMSIAPAPAGAGISFIRIDVPVEQQTIPARYDLVTDTQLCTRLTNEHGVSVGTVEHVMAALAGCGVQDAIIALDGPEVPIMDGSSAPFVNGIAAAGLEAHGEALLGLRILRTVEVTEGEKIARLEPSEAFEMDFSIEFADRAIGAQHADCQLVNGAFASELSDCRTFGHLSEVEYLRSIGLARGGSLQNAIVVDSGRVLNPEGLRRPDEFVRHKMLDAIGDLALAGMPIIGRYVGVKSGHGMTNRLLHAVFSSPDAWELAPVEAGLGIAALPPVLPRSGEVTALAG